MAAIWYAFVRFWTHLLSSGGLIIIYILVLAWVVRRKKMVVDPRMVLVCACFCNLVTGLINEAWDYPSDGPYKTGSDVASWFAGSILIPWGLYRVHKWWSEST